MAELQIRHQRPRAACGNTAACPVSRAQLRPRSSGTHVHTSTPCLLQSQSKTPFGHLLRAYLFASWLTPCGSLSRQQTLFVTSGLTPRGGRRATIKAWLFGHNTRRETGHAGQIVTTPIRGNLRWDCGPHQLVARHKHCCKYPRRNGQQKRIHSKH